MASSERSSSSGAAPLPSAVKPLLDSKLEEIKTILGSLVPEKKKRNVLEEAMYEEEPGGFETEVMMQGNVVSQPLTNSSVRVCENFPTSVVDLWKSRNGPTISRCSYITSSGENPCAVLRPCHSYGGFCQSILLANTF